MTGPVQTQLTDRFDALRTLVRAVSGRAAAGADPESVSAARTLVDRAAARLRLWASGASGHTVVALAGATGGGKSSLFNALARLDLSPPGHLRPTTGEAHACVWGADGAGELLDWLGVAPTRRFTRESALDGQDEAALRGLVLLDLPDVDSVAIDHRVEAERYVGVVDLVIWVMDPQKYADQTVHDEYFRHMGALRDVTVVVFNQIDRLRADDAARCLADLSRLLAADGLPNVPVLATSAVTGEGIGSLRTLLEQTVATRRAALTRLGGELDASVAALATMVDPDGSADAGPRDEIPREAIAELADSLAAAAGVDAIAVQARREYARRAALPWPRRTPESAIPPADRAATALAARRLADRTTDGFPAVWQDEVRQVAGAAAKDLPEQLATALYQARPPLPRTIGWRLARVAFWLGIVAVVAGGAWALTRWWPAGPTWLPWAVVGGGAVLSLGTLGIGTALARARARRFGTLTQTRLRAATASVAREAIAPVRIVVRDYLEARDALESLRLPAAVDHGNS
jgi:energy-coupling factor transporter ATP-binding protein EcfA2